VSKGVALENLRLLLSTIQNRLADLLTACCLMSQRLRRRTGRFSIVQVDLTGRVILVSLVDLLIYRKFGLRMPNWDSRGA
jgi:hypothetical protein